MDFSKQHGVGKSKVKNVEAELDKYRIHIVKNQQIEDMKASIMPIGRTYSKQVVFRNFGNAS
jgi:hypothetical protein